MKIKISESQLKKIINIISEEESKKLNVLFIGDSLSSGKGYSWNYLLESAHPEWNVDHLVYPGKRTDWMLENLVLQLDKKNYDLAFIYGGTNDMFSLVSINTALGNIQKMVDLINEQGGKVYVYSGYDVESVTTNKYLKPTIYCNMDCMIKGRDKLIEFQNKLSTIKNAVVIPPVPADETWSYDGIHLRPGKDQIVKDYVENYIDNIPTNLSKKNIDKDDFLKKLNDLINNNLNINSSDTKIVNMLIDGLENMLHTNKPLKFEDKSFKDSNIPYIKTALQILGYLPSEFGINSEFDSETYFAIKEFQKENDLSKTGIIDYESIREIIEKIENENIKDIDLKKLELNKTDSTDEDWFDDGFDGEFNASIDNSIISKFKNVLEKYNISYSSFVNDCKSIGLDPEIAIAQLHAESGFAPDVINCSRKSSAGAMGIAQFMPSTWTTYGGGSDPCNPKDALKAYIKLMDKLIDMFPNRIDLAVAGYNSGPYLKVYSDALKNDKPFKEIKDRLPLETRGYVKKILEL